MIEGIKGDIVSSLYLFIKFKYCMFVEDHKSINEMILEK
jgi:hypothetical protein